MYVVDYVIVGANSVLAKSIFEGGGIVMGNPARVIRQMTDDELIKLKSWNKKK